jgi:hypothetical protein
MARGVVLAVITMAFNPIYLRNNISLSLRLQNNDTKQKRDWFVILLINS